MRGRLLIALAIWIAWTALAVFFAVTASLTYISQGRPPYWGLSIAVSLAQWWPWALLTPLVVWLTHRLPLTPGRLVLTVPIHLVSGAAVGIGKALIENAARQWLLGVRPYLLINNVALQMLIYWALVGGAVIVDRFGRNQARAAEMEARLSQAQVQLLRSQLQPHFLFNALNAASELVHEDPEKADRMIGLLSDLLRATLDAGDRPEVPLADEVGLVERYLAIQRIRFADRLHVEMSIAEDCAAILVPHLCLQPLVENAIRHGLSARARGGSIWIRALRQDRSVAVVVEDDGVGLRPAAVDGIGLSNTRARLKSLYGGRGSLSVGPRAGGGTVATMRVPDTGRETVT